MLEVSSRLIYDRGKPVGIQGIARDITERRRAQEALRLSELRYRTLADAVPQLIWVNDGEGRTEYVNRRWQEYTGYRLDGQGQSSLPQIIHPDDLPHLMEARSAGFQSGEEYEVECRIRRADGTYRWHLSRAVPLRDEQGHVLQWFGTATDIHAIKQAEEDNARLYGEAQEANRLKDEFLATVSHELRTPLNAILGWAEMLRGGRLDQETTARAFDTIVRNARSQAQLIEDILDVSRIITGKLNLDMQPTGLVPIISAAVEAVRPAVYAKEIGLSLNLDAEVGSVSGDPNRLQQVVWNLLSNAIKFTPRGGRVEVRLERADSAARIVVSDSGIGIEKEFLPHVFDRFRQADSTYTRRHGGLGLGLAIVRHLIEMHGGTVEADSPGEGHGAKFAVSLPLARGEAARVKDEMLPPDLHAPDLTLTALLAGMWVLVVDDEHDARELITAALEHYGARVTAVPSVREAMAVVGAANGGRRPDLVLSDIGMPDEDGFALIGKLRAMEQQSGETIPAVALTAYARESERALALAAGFQMHIPKPFKPAELALAIAGVARGGRKGEGAS